MKRFFKCASLPIALSALMLTSCLDFDATGSEFKSNESQVDTWNSKNTGKADSLFYKKVFTATDVKKAAVSLKSVLADGIGAQYAMRGGKDGVKPAPHSYQYRNCLGIDNYVQYAVIPHQVFPYAKVKVTSTYDVNPKFYGGSMGSFAQAASRISPLLNHGSIDSIPEVKAIYLLLYNYAAVEVADVYGAVPYTDLKNNVQTAPYNYQDLPSIYKKAINNIDSIVACLKYFETKPADYKNAVVDVLDANIRITSDKKLSNRTLDTWVRFANSLKLRLAMHVVKVAPADARKWAEEAVQSGVIEEKENEVCLPPASSGFSHPLVEISENWHDTRLSASFESLLASLNHPYMKYLFEKNDAPIVNKKTKVQLAADSKIVGIRSGTYTGDGQAYDGNQYIAFSRVNSTVIWSAPLYLMKLSEVCFLRAEGAVRGWNMMGNAKDFYEKGIKKGSCEDRENYYQDENGDNPYDKGIDAYIQQENATPYTYVDPTGETDPVESVTKIGVKWNDGDTPEMKLEKIITQKYIAAYPESYETWVDLRRTGYPKLFEILNAEDSDGSIDDGETIRRLPFPGKDDPVTFEDLRRTAFKTLTGGDYVATRLWWDTKGPNFQ